MFSNKIISIVFEIQTQPKNGVENDVLGCSYEQQIIGGIQLFAIGYQTLIFIYFQQKNQQQLKIQIWGRKNSIEPVSQSLKNKVIVKAISILRFAFQFSFQQIQNNNNINKDMIGFQALRQFNSRIGKFDNISSILDHYEETYNLRRYKISEITPKEAEKMYENIEKKFYKYYSNGENSVWFENQLRLFVWLLVCYLQSCKKTVRLMNKQDWELFSQVFYVKQPILFQYQAKILLDYSLCLQRWNQEQDQMLKKVVGGALKIKWSQIAKTLFILSQSRFVRTSKQCRQRWLNHLDPSKSKDEWNIEQCIQLIKSVLERGKKWANLVLELKGKRSEHSIKNKYNSMMIKQSKQNPHLNETDKCKNILKQLELQSLEHKKDEEIPLVLLVPGIRPFQNQKMEQMKNQNEISLEKSNASLAQTLNISSKNEENNNQDKQLNFDDLWLDLKPNPMMSSCVVAQDLRRSKRGRKNKKQETQLTMSAQYDRNEADLDWKTQQSEIQSLVFLQQLKLMIRESQLDR